MHHIRTLISSSCPSHQHLIVLQAGAVDVRVERLRSDGSEGGKPTVVQSMRGGAGCASTKLHWTSRLHRNCADFEMDTFPNTWRTPYSYSFLTRHRRAARILRRAIAADSRGGGRVCRRYRGVGGALPWKRALRSSLLPPTLFIPLIVTLPPELYCLGVTPI